RVENVDSTEWLSDLDRHEIRNGLSCGEVQTRRRGGVRSVWPHDERAARDGHGVVLKRPQGTEVPAKGRPSVEHARRRDRRVLARFADGARDTPQERYERQRNAENEDCARASTERDENA